jgi:hypothetical protein
MMKTSLPTTDQTNLIPDESDEDTESRLKGEFSDILEYMIKLNDEETTETIENEKKETLPIQKEESEKGEKEEDEEDEYLKRKIKEITPPYAINHERKFYKNLIKYYIKINRNDLLERMPKMGFRTLDLYNLFYIVLSMGGYDAISDFNTADGSWIKIFRKLDNYRSTITNSSVRLKSYYQKYLEEYETINKYNYEEEYVMLDDRESQYEIQFNIFNVELDIDKNIRCEINNSHYGNEFFDLIQYNMILINEGNF